MKRTFIFFVLIFLVISCEKKSKLESSIEEIPVAIKVTRFDKEFFQISPEDLPRLKAKYPFFFPPGNDDEVWINKMKDPQWRELYGEVEKKYPDFEIETRKIESLFKHIKHYFPNTKTPKVYTVISEMDYSNKVIYSNDMLIICLELYLGKQHRFYQFPDYIKQNFSPSQILPDIAAAFAVKKIPPPTDATFLSQMIYAGKELYLMDILLPDESDADKIGYKAEQITWCEENEDYMWRYLVENQMLYSTDQKLLQRFINPAPFSKFYLEIDNESPGKIGGWLGWQIVRSYMKNNDVTAQKMLLLDAKELFEKSKYKPKK